MKDWIFVAIMFASIFILLIFAQRQFRKDLPDLLEQWRKDRLTAYKSKMSKLYTKYKKTKNKLEVDKPMGKENVQFNAYDNSNERIKMLIESFAETYEVDMHEFEKNLFCMAYEKGYADGQYDFKKSIMDEE